MSDEQVPIYRNTVDGGMFAVEVVRLGDYQGRLTVTVVETGQVLLDNEVGLAYGAAFGPDVEDVEEWQVRAIEAIDAYLAE